MPIARRLIVLVTALVITSPLSAADLSQVERSLVKAPVYKSKPRYCLLAFGPEAKMRVWLVQDGDTLYVDRNGNGDLTEGGEKIAAKKNSRTAEPEAKGVYEFEV